MYMYPKVIAIMQDISMRYRTHSMLWLGGRIPYEFKTFILKVWEFNQSKVCTFSLNLLQHFLAYPARLKRIIRT